MNVVRRIGYAALMAALLTAVAITQFPDYRFSSYVTEFIAAGVLLTLVLTTISFYREGNLTMHDKNRIMTAFLLVILVPSFYAAGAFVHESETSWSKGEIHYHADFEVLVEENGELRELDLIDPGEFCEKTSHESTIMCKLNDRTGSKEYHEHNDDRIHLEGTFKTMEEASLAAFFEQFGGELTDRRLVFPTNDGTVTRTEDGGRIKILVRRGVAGNRHWCVIDRDAEEQDLCINQHTGKKSSSTSEYVISPYSRGPNLDDIFIVYDSRGIEEALQDVRQDGKYRGNSLTKEGSGYGG